MNAMWFSLQVCIRGMLLVVCYLPHIFNVWGNGRTTSAPYFPNVVSPSLHFPEPEPGKCGGSEEHFGFNAAISGANRSCQFRRRAPFVPSGKSLTSATLPSFRINTTPRV